MKLMKFNRIKCNVLHLSWNSPQYQYRLEDELIKKTPAEKNLGVLKNKRLGMTQYCVLIGQKGNHLHTSKEAWPRGCGKSFCTSTHLICSTASSSEAPSARKMWTYKSRSSRESQKLSQSWNLSSEDRL